LLRRRLISLESSLSDEDDDDEESELDEEDDEDLDSSSDATVFFLFSEFFLFSIAPGGSGLADHN
jgi:hypothetical protein